MSAAEENAGFPFGPVQMLIVGFNEPKFRGEAPPPPSMVTATQANPYSVEDNEKRLLKEALMKARVGDTVKVKAPRGTMEFKILEIV